MSDRDLSRLSEFECQRCNECCRQPGYVYLAGNEADKIAEHLNLTAFDFVNQYCELVDRRRIVLKKAADEACVFLNQDGCSIHDVKPSQCREFPFKWRTERSFDYCRGLKKIYGE